MADVRQKGGIVYVIEGSEGCGSIAHPDRNRPPLRGRPVPIRARTGSGMICIEERKRGGEKENKQR